MPSDHDGVGLLQKLLEHADEKRMNEQASVFGAVTLQDLPYFTENATVRLLDLYLPENAQGLLPIIVDIHGGAWIYGSKEINKNYCMYLASQGFAVVNIDYMPLQYDDLRDQVSEILCAYRWVLKNADSYGLDKNAIFLCGNSSGAHLALLSYIVNLSNTLRTIYNVEHVPFTAKAFGLVTPVADLHFFTNSMLPPALKFTSRFFGDRPKMSPQYFCASISDVLRAGMTMPPVYLIGSEEDFFKGQSMQLDHTLTRRNVKHVFRYCEKGKAHKLGHSFPVLFPEYTESVAVNREMLAYFCEQM